MEILKISKKDFNSLIDKKISEDEQKPFIKIVNKILTITKRGDYLENFTEQAKVCEYKKRIDKMVYKLYGLTKEEIEVIENYNSDKND